MKPVMIAVLSVLFAGTLTAQLPPPTHGGTVPQQQQPQATPAPPAGPHSPQAKSPEELTAYQTAVALNDPAALEAAANEFATKYPASELRSALFQKDLSLYQNANNADKMIEVGRKVLAIDAENAATMVTVASALAGSTRKTDLDAAEKWTEATKNIDGALQLLSSGKGVPENIPAANVEPYKHLVMSMAYAAQGTINFHKEDYPAAEQSLRKSVGFTDISQDPVSWIQLAIALDKQNKYAEGLKVAEQCMTLGQSAATDLCKQEAARLRKLASAPQPPTAK